MSKKTPFERAMSRIMAPRFKLMNGQRKDFNEAKKLCPDRNGQGGCENKGHVSFAAGNARCRMRECPWLNPVVRIGYKKTGCKRLRKKRMHMCDKCLTVYPHHFPAKTCCEGNMVVKVWLDMKAMA